MTRLLASALALLAVGCDGSPPAPTDPTEVVLGEPTVVVVVNPAINDVNDVALPEPGLVRADVDVTDLDAAVGGPTGPEGVVVLPLPDGGARTLALVGDGIDGVVETSLGPQDLIEVAVAADGDAAAVMHRNVFAFGGEVVELTPEMGVEAVNDALAASDRIVLLGGGTYVGDLVFGGSRVVLFGAGAEGGAVIVDGSVTVSGSGNRIRGVHVGGDLDFPGSDGAVSFSRIDGATLVGGSDVALIQNAFCGAVDVSGSDVTAVGNTGLAPLAPDGC